jgi:hypothetical protein
MTIRTRAAALTGAAVSVALLAGIAHAQQAERTSSGRRGGVASGVTLPNVPIYALTSDNAIYVLRTSASQYVRLGRINVSDGGNVIGIDFRPADNTPNRLYALTDRGGIYNVALGGSSVGSATLVSTMNPRFTGGFGMLADFNPVVNALRVIGSNDQNLAVVNTAATGANLGTVATQTKLAYAAGDVNNGKDPEIVGGAYTNNIVGATTTLFYAIDHDLDTLVTIAPPLANGSSATGGGQLQTIGNFFDESGNRLNMSPTSDLDIYTDRSGRNFLVGQTTRLLFSIDLSQINPNLMVGQTQRVVVRRGPPAPLPGATAPLTGGVFDIAIPPPAQ